MVAPGRHPAILTHELPPQGLNAETGNKNIRIETSCTPRGYYHYICGLVRLCSLGRLASCGNPPTHLDDQ